MKQFFDAFDVFIARGGTLAIVVFCIPFVLFGIIPYLFTSGIIHSFFTGKTKDDDSLRIPLLTAEIEEEIPQTKKEVKRVVRTPVIKTGAGGLASFRTLL